MILGVRANRSSFVPVRFTPGLNLVVAERTAESTPKDTRNGLGKSTLIDIIDFCLGARVTRGRGLAIEPLRRWEFTLDLSLAGNNISIKRSVDDPSVLIVTGLERTSADLPHANLFGERSFRSEEWRAFLGCRAFPSSAERPELEYVPTFRSLISYFVRTGKDAYAVPFRHARQQSPWNVQLSIAYLLGLNWEFVSRLQELKDRERTLQALVNAIDSGAIDFAFGSIGELEAERIQFETQFEREFRALESFRVHSQYESIEYQVNQNTAAIHRLTNDNIADRRRLDRYRESVANEDAPSDDAIDYL